MAYRGLGATGCKEQYPANITVQQGIQCGLTFGYGDMCAALLRRGKAECDAATAPMPAAPVVPAGATDGGIRSRDPADIVDEIIRETDVETKRRLMDFYERRSEESPVSCSVYESIDDAGVCHINPLMVGGLAIGGLVLVKVLSGMVGR